MFGKLDTTSPPDGVRRLIGVDPGKTSGLAIFKETGELEFAGQLDIAQMVDFSTSYQQDVWVVVVEDFVVFKKRARQQAGSRMHAPQVIGMMEVFAARTGAKLIKQDADLKNHGAKLSGKRPPANHALSHEVDAYNHIYVRMHEMGIIKSKLEQERLGND